MTVQITKSDQTGDGSDDIRLENDQIFVQVTGDNLQNRLAFNSGGRVGEGDVTGSVETDPHNPYSFTEKDSAQHQSTTTFEIVTDTESVGAYRVTREYNYPTNDLDVEISWEVTLHEGDDFVLLDMTITNIDDEPIELDQDSGDIHDGIMLLNGNDLVGRNKNEDDYRFHLAGQGTRHFQDQVRFETYSGTDWGTVFDDQDAATYGLIEGDTSPKMWVHHGGILDYQVQETTLDPNQTISYTLVVGVHEGGDSAPSDGQQIYETASNRASQTFHDGFEDGDYSQDPSWSVIWYPESGGPRNILNDWQVDQQNTISGNYSLHLHSISDNNAIATDDRLIDLSDDFEISYKYYTNESNNRGGFAFLLDSDRNGDSGANRVNKSDRYPLAMPHRHPLGSTDAEFTVLGVTADPGLTKDDEFQTGVVHKVRVVKQGQAIRGYHDGNLLVDTTVSQISVPTDRTYRLSLQSSGGFGEESHIWFDDVTVNHGAINNSPTAAFTFTPSDPVVGEEVEFDASGSTDPDGSIRTFEWDFDDDDTFDKTGETVTHTFSEAGDFSVTLKVTDDDGSTDESTQQVSIPEQASLELHAVRPVQTVENSFVDDPNISEDIPNPDIVATRPTSVLFELQGENVDKIDDRDTVRLTVSTDTGTEKTSEIRGKRIKELVSRSDTRFGEVKVFADAPRAERPPIFNIDPEIETLRVSIAKEQEDIVGASVERSPGSDFGMTDSLNLRIGFIEIRSPEDGSGSSDWAYGRREDGRFDPSYTLPGGDDRLSADDPRSKFHVIVEETKRYLKRIYPVKGIDTKIHPTPMQGVKKDVFPDFLEPGKDYFEDLRNAHDRLTAEFGHLDATVAITPFGYRNYHNIPGIGVELGISGDSQPQTAAWVMDIFNIGGTATTAAQEIGHHLEGPDAYPDPLAQRDPSLIGGPDIDNSHARTEGRKNGNGNVIDNFALRSISFDLFENTFSILREGALRGYWGRGRTNIDTSQSSWALGSFMSYSSDDVWTDAHVYQRMLDDAFAPTPPVVSDSDNEDTSGSVVTGLGAVDDEGKAHILTMTKRHGQPLPEDPSGNILFDMIDVNNSVASSLKTKDSLLVFGHSGENQVVEDVFAFSVDFPETTRKMIIKHSDHGTEIDVIPHTTLLFDAVSDIPDNGFKRVPDQRRRALDEKLDAIEKQIDQKTFRDTKQKLKNIRDKIEKWLKDEYETAASEVTKQEMLDLVEDMQSRLETLSQSISRDEYGSIFKNDSIGISNSVVTKIDSQEDTGTDTKAGVIVRNNIEESGKSTGYVICAVTPDSGFVFEWDTDENGYLDQSESAGTTTYPAWLKLEKSGTTFTGYYSTDGTTWTEIGSAEISSADETQDAGMFATSGDPDAMARVEFGEFSITNN